MNKRSLRPILYTSLIALIISITLLSLLPPKSTIDLGSKDKISHLIAYLCLSINAFLLVENKKYLIILFVTICYGIIIEYFQSFVPGRFPSFDDAVANSIGCILGLIIILGYKYIKQKYFQDV